MLGRAIPLTNENKNANDAADCMINEEIGVPWGSDTTVHFCT